MSILGDELVTTASSLGAMAGNVISLARGLWSSESSIVMLTRRDVVRIILFSFRSYAIVSCGLIGLDARDADASSLAAKAACSDH